MKPKFYVIFRECVEDGISRGVMRAFKHTNTPSMDQIIDEATNAAMNEIHEYFEFDDVPRQE